MRSRRLNQSMFALGTSLVLVLAITSTVLAQDFIANMQLGAATIDVHSRIPTVTISVDCLENASFVRFRATLTQKVAGDISSSQQSNEGQQCVAGTPLSVDLVFGPQQGTFKPGNASISGFVAANDGTGGDDLESIPLTDIFLKTH